MTAEVVNLRRVRKAKLKAGKSAEASANRALFGRTRGERELRTLETTRAEHHLDNHRRSGAIKTGDGED